LSTCYSTSYVSQTRVQKHFTNSEVAADWCLYKQSFYNNKTKMSSTQYSRKPSKTANCQQS